MLKDRLQSAQTIVSAGLIGEGVKVVFDSKVPHADLKNRVMHLRPLPEEVSEDALLHLRADCDHEMGHFGFTDPTSLEGLTRPIVKLIANAIEDGFIEKRVSERWLGCAQNLARSNDKLRGDLCEQLAPGGVNGLRALAINGLQMLAFGQTLEDVYAAFGRDIEPLYAPVADLLPQLPLVADSHRSVKLATEFADRWRWGRPEPPPLVVEIAQGEIAGEGPDEGGSLTESEAEALVAVAVTPLLLGEMRKASIAQFPFSDCFRYRAYTEEDVVEAIDPLEDEGLVAQFVESVRHVVPALRRRLLMEFSGAGRRFEGNRRRGEIDQRALHKVALGSDRVFRVKVPEIVIDADVTLVIDASGSMRCGAGRSPRPKVFVAAQAACAFSMVLDRIGVSHEAVAFTTIPNLGRAPMRHACDPARGWAKSYERIRPLRHLIVKPAAQTFRRCRARFAALANFDELADNCDGESVMWAAQRLAARSRPGMKPILIVFSDGIPQSTPEDASVLNTHLKHTVERIERAGITCIGVGIGDESVARFYKTYTVIEDVSDLVATSYAVIRAALRWAKRRAS